MNNTRNSETRFELAFVFIAAMAVTGLTWMGQLEARTIEELCQEYKMKAGPKLKRLDLNKATEEELQALPGVGVKTARAIVDHRKAIGGYKSLEQLRRVRGVGDKVYDCLKDLVTIGNP